MSAVATPNGLVLLGLLCILFGLLILSSAFELSLAGLPERDERPAGLRGYRRVALSASFALLCIGLVLAILGQLVIASMSPAIAMAMLALAFALLIFALLADLAGARLDAAAVAPDASCQSETATPLEVRNIDTPRTTERLRIAG